MHVGEAGLDAAASSFFFGDMLGEEPDAGLGDELDEDLDGHLDGDLDEELEVDEDGSSPCAPYLARQMSCLGSRTPGVKDTPFLGLARGRDAPKMHLLFQSLCLIICSGIFPYLNKTAESDAVFSKVSFLVIFARI